MTLDIAALRALAEAATRPPWEAAEVIHDNELIANVIRTRDGFLPSVQQGDYATIDYTPEDAAFIAAARTALPEALAEIERLRAEVAALRRPSNAAFREALDRNEQLRAALLESCDISDALAGQADAPERSHDEGWQSNLYAALARLSALRAVAGGK